MLQPDFEPLTRLLTVQPDYEPVGQLVNRSGAHGVRKRVNKRASAVRKRVNKPAGQKAGPHVRWTSQQQWSDEPRAGARVKLPDTVSMEPFLQYITARRPQTSLIRVLSHQFHTIVAVRP